MKKQIIAILVIVLGITLVGCSTGKAKEENFDVVVIGSGGAGLSAAIEAKEVGANVIVIEKNAIVGGNTIRATGGMNAAGTPFQEAKGITDTPEVMYQDTMKGGKNLNNPELVKILTQNSADAIAWLTKMGADLSDVGAAGGATNNRIHRPANGAKVGDEVIRVLSENAEKLGVDIRTKYEAVELLTKDGAVTGVRVKTKDGEVILNAKVVVDAAGGFGANPEMLEALNPKLKGFKTTNQSGATGDGIKMAEAIGADTVDMDQIQTHPTVEPTTSEMITEGVRGEGAVLINRAGKRFIDELKTRDIVSEAILAQEGATAFLVFNQEIRDNYKAIESYMQLGIITEFATLEELATFMKADPAALKATIEAYAGAITSGTDEFGRTNFGKITFTDGPWYAVEVTPAVHHTMGGLKINTSTQVLDKSGQPIKGLYAAGEVTGGVHGANRLGGNAVADIIVFGRIAGQNAAKEALGGK